MNDIPMIDVYFWSDGTWCLREEYSIKGYLKPSNFKEVSFPLNMSNLEISFAVLDLVVGNKL